MQVSVLGIDLGKNSCSLVGLDGIGQVVVRRRMRRETVIAFAAKLSPCIVAMEACCGAHHMGRALAAQGHTVRLMSPEYVRPYVKAQKNDDRDAEAIAEAATRPTMRFVELKTRRAARHADTPPSTRSAGRRAHIADEPDQRHSPRAWPCRAARPRQAEGPTAVSCSATPRRSVHVSAISSPICKSAGSGSTSGSPTSTTSSCSRRAADEHARRLLTIPGIGALNATALVAAVGNARTFARGRDLAAWLGLVPRQATTGGKPQLLGITKRGSKYLRKMLIQGARAAMPTLRQSETRLGAWLRGLLARAHPNTAVVALAAKMARIVWALLRHGRTYKATAVAGLKRIGRRYRAGLAMSAGGERKMA